MLALHEDAVNLLGIFSQFWRRKTESAPGQMASDMTCANLTVSQLAVGPKEEAARHRVEGGVDLRPMAPGAMIEAKTKNSLYTIRIGTSGRILLSGHPEHCPELTEVLSVGAVLLTGSVCDGYLAPGMRMEFRVGARRVFTSRLLSVNVISTGGA